MKSLLKIISITAIVTPTLFGCSRNAEETSETFNSLLTIIEEGEEILESGKAKFSLAEKDFLDCLVSQTKTNSIECAEEMLYLDSVYDETLKSYDFQSLIARMNALRLVDNESATQARDAFVQHLDAWRSTISDLKYSLPNLEELYKHEWSFLDKWDEIGQESTINGSFQETCSSLGNAQPENSDEFAQRIIDICDE